MSQCDYCGCWFSNSIIDAHMYLHEHGERYLEFTGFDSPDDFDDFDEQRRQPPRPSWEEVEPRWLRSGIGHADRPTYYNDSSTAVNRAPRFVKASVNEIIEGVAQLNVNAGSSSSQPTQLTQPKHSNKPTQAKSFPKPATAKRETNNSNSTMPKSENAGNSSQNNTEKAKRRRRRKKNKSNNPGNTNAVVS